MRDPGKLARAAVLGPAHRRLAVEHDSGVGAAGLDQAALEARGALADLELRHRRQARCEDRIRCAKDTGLRNLPLHGFDQNRIWCALVALAADLTAWMQTLALSDHHARRWEPKRLRHRLLSIPGRLVVTGRRRLLHLSAAAPCTALALTALTALAKLAAPG